MRWLMVNCVMVALVAPVAWCDQDATPGQLQECLGIARGMVAQGVEDREPVGTAEVFPPDVERVYCFVEIEGAKGETHITHVWYWGGQEMASVELPVRSNRWRTWSSKRIIEDWTGGWRVEVLDSTGAVLQSLPFEISASKSE